MKKQIWIVAISPILTLTSTLTLASTLALALTLTACNIAPGAEAENTEAARPLDQASWPTPQPTAVQAAPTPFPKITLAPTDTPTPRPSEAMADSSSVGEGGLTFSGDIGELVKQVTQLSGGYPPTAAAMVTADETAIHQGPATSYPSLGTAQQGELAAILGQNSAGDWRYVLTRSAVQGWLPAEALQVTFTLGEAPVLPDAPAPQEPASAINTASPLGELEAVAVALVTAGGSLPIRLGPAASYPVSGTVEQGELAGVFGVNTTGNWLYVYTISGVNGWLPAESVRITGSLADAPVLPANLLAASAPPIESSSASDANNPVTNSAGVEPLVPDQLRAVAKARVDNAGLNLRQGPGAGYEQLGTLSRDDEVSLLALNKTGDWALVKTADGAAGWVSLDYLAIEGSLADAPQVISPAPGRYLPPGQVAPLFPSSSDSNAAAPGASRGSAQPGADATPLEPASTSGAALTPASLSPVTRARARGSGMDLYAGPGISYATIVTLSLDEGVAVLARSQDGAWALVKPDNTYRSPGWAPLEDLSLDGSLADAPQVITAWVDSNELSVRRGPGLFYEQTGQVAINTLVAVLGVNQGRNWALIQPIMSSGQGWIQINFLTLAGDWADVPVASAPPAEASSQASPASPPANVTRPGTLVFQTSSGGDIMVANPDGSGLQRLTQGIDPALSPDGRTVAFTRWTGEDGALWLIDVDGSNERPVLGGTRQAKHPAWSPDGQRVVVNFQQGGRLDPRQVCQNLIDLGDKQPDIPWNVDPDSVKAKFIDNLPYLCWTLPPDPHWGLRVFDTASGGFEDVPSDTYSFGPEWDPANPWRIVSSGQNGLVQLDVNRSEGWALTDRLEDHTPVFSPDGRYIAIAFNNNGHFDIHRLNSDGSGRLPLTKTPLWVTAQPGDNQPWNSVSPAWSPDGSQIAFLTDRAGRWEIWVMNVDGSNQRPMFPDQVNDQLQISYDFVDERMLSWN